MIPILNKAYVPTPYYNELKTLISIETFFPVLITGPSGVGKTESVLQCCTELKRDILRVNITIESDEDSLMGGWRLENGNTVFHKGPIIEAMEKGWVLLLDEIDLGSPTKIMCLQSVLEGKGYFIKKINEQIMPAHGFTIVATANTKGIGDDTGKYIGTQLLNEAALDRFPITLEAGFPGKPAERKILQQHAKLIGLDIEKDTIDILLTFANNIRKTIETTQEVTYNISTRRLVDILKTYKVFGDLERAIELCIARFDDYHQVAYMKAFKALLPSTLEAKTIEEVNYKKIKPY